MRRLGGILGIVLLAAWGALLPARIGQAEGGEASLRGAYFAETGHHVQGAFWDFFQAHGGVEVLGLPLTEEFIVGRAVIQLFERVALERPLGTETVRLAALGEKLGKGKPPLPPSAIPSGEEAQRRYFPSTGHAVCPAFLGFFEAQGGAAFFGCPISEIVVEDGVIAQYFQNARLEWHPADEGGGQVRLGSLGREYLQVLNPPESLLRPAKPLALPTLTPTSTVPPPTPTHTPTVLALPKLPLLPAAAPDLRLDATVKYPVSGQSGYQTVYVKVKDWQGRQVQQARVDVIVRSQAEVKAAFITKTDSSGRAALTFDIGASNPGQAVVIDVQASRGGLKGFTQTSFTPWW